MSLLAVDPGACSGWAVFDGDALSASGIAREPRSFDVAELWVESQEIWKGSRARPRDIIKLAHNAGEWVGLNPHARAAWVPPRTWKGSARKEWCTRRILAALRPAEREYVEGLPIAKSYKHNMIDAIGIGLYAVGRFRAGKAVRA
jgi:hypothetical protein